MHSGANTGKEGIDTPNRNIWCRKMVLFPWPEKTDKFYKNADKNVEKSMFH